jgi:hypothetical protein
MLSQSNSHNKMKPQPYRQILRCESDRAQAIRLLTSRKLDTPQLVTITEYVPDHSGAQQRFYRVICRELGDSLGYMPSEMAEIFKGEFLPAILWADSTKTTFHKIAREVETVRNRFGNDQADRLRALFIRQLSTNELNRKQMTAYIEQCLDFAAQHGVVIETPEELRERAKPKQKATK